MNTIFKNHIQIVILSLVCLSFVACEKDNFDPPSRKLTGNIIYNGETVGVKGVKEGKDQGEKNSSVQLQLWQLNMSVEEAMVVSVAQDGSFSALLFDGDYRLVAKDGNGPWENRHDTVYFSLRGKSIKVDYPVVPYYTISNTEFRIDGDLLKSSFTVTQISEENKGIEAVSLLLNNSIFVDLKTQIDKVSINNAASGEQELSLNIAKWLESEKGLYARVAVKIKGIEEAVYSSVVFKVK